MIIHPDTEYGPAARNRLAEAGTPAPDGAQAALETFYYAFNRRDLEVLKQVWLPSPLVQLDNPLGGILRGSGEVVRLYGRILPSDGLTGRRSSTRAGRLVVAVDIGTTGSRPRPWMRLRSATWQLGGDRPRRGPGGGGAVPGQLGHPRPS